MNHEALWRTYQGQLCSCPEIGITVDVSRMGSDAPIATSCPVDISQALEAMQALEGGTIANADENRMVGHYWLRAPQRAPSPDITEEIEHAIDRVKQFAADVHSGVVTPPTGDGFYVVLLIGIGGSVLGPEFVCDALSSDDAPMLLRVIDNTDPDGIDRVLQDIGGLLSQTLTVVVSKSGGTKETRNGMLEVAAAYERAGLIFAQHAVAITQCDSALDKLASSQQWIARFPMWDWVGGRTSVTSAVGLLLAALVGIDVDAFLAGAREADQCSRAPEVSSNPAALLALAWRHAIHEDKRRSMVVLPYRDRLALLGKYLQQLVMESVGKRLDRAGQAVHEGISVFGNKGTSDQHSYVQQLIEGPNDYFATFVEVLRDRDGAMRNDVAVEEGITAGDYLSAFLHGTRDALTEAGRSSMTITLDRLDARRLGSLIALFERAVGLYAELVNVNAYHQPGVEAGKRAADDYIQLQRAILALLPSHSDELQEGSTVNKQGNGRGAATEEKVADGVTAQEIANALGKPDRAEAVYHILRHLSANPQRGVACADEVVSIGSQFMQNRVH